jgi:HTH-type transcriptional regulator / antitoxin HipB
MSFALRIPDQLKQHLRALRKSRGLTQGQLGALVGVRQARIAEIEANPGVVSLDQLIKLLAALGGTLYLHGGEGADAETRVVPDKEPRQAQRAPTGQRKPTGASKSAPVTRVVIRSKKGTW